MNTDINLVQFIQGIVELGASGLLLYFLFVVWKDRKETVNKKDERIKQLSDSVVDIVRQNTKVQEELKSSINQNTEATKTLTNYIYEALKK